MKKDNFILKLEEELYNPKPPIDDVLFEKVKSGLYKYKDYFIHKVDDKKKRLFSPMYPFHVYKNDRFIIKTKRLMDAKIYFKSINK
jgi:hypothetical protein|tara:strand:+ start:9542 stop:9799 length:258 start_codon:yes stop_codon:yes gene_type:complete